MSTAKSLLQLPTGRPRLFQDITAFECAINAYFELQDAKGLKAEKPPVYTMEGLARALRCSRMTLLRYDELYTDEPAFCDAVKQARQRVAEWTEERLYRAGQHPASPIFSLKNNFGWRDEQRVELNVAITVGIEASDAQRQGLLPDLVIQQIRPAPDAQLALSPVRTEATGEGASEHA